MKTKIFVILVSMLLFTTVLPIVALKDDKNNLKLPPNVDYQTNMLGFFGNDDILDQKQNIDCGHGWFVLNDCWEAQGFIPTLPILTRVKLYIFGFGTPNTNELIVTIRNNLTGEDLTEATIYTTPSSQWVEFDFPNIGVTPGENYYIVCKAPEGNDYDNCYCWFFGIENPYENGEAWYSTNYGASWDIREYLPDFPENDFCFETYGLDQWHPDIPNIEGPTEGTVGEEYEYTFLTTDPENDDISYYVDWGDDTATEWSDFVESGTEITLTHSWEEQDSYIVKAKAKDIHGAEGEWGTLEVTMPINQIQPYQQILIKFFENHPNLFPLLQRLLGL